MKDEAIRAGSRTGARAHSETNNTGLRMHTLAQKPKPRRAEPARPRAAHAGRNGGAHPIVQLQRTIGNQGVQRMLRSASAGGGMHPAQPVPTSPGRPLDSATRGQLQGMPALRVREAPPAAPAPSDGSLAVVPGAHASEREADAAERAALLPGPWEAGGPDLGHVRIHTGPAAAESARRLNAAAYTVGQDIVFGAGQYAPGTAAGRALLAHEVAHTQQQSRTARPALQRRELNPTPVTLLTTPRGPQDWYFPDRMQWQQASVAGTIAGLPRSNTFIQAAYYNTRNLRPGEYTNIEQRHDYYDLISYVIEHDPNTPAAARGVRFFHATTLVTGSPGIGTVDSPVGAWSLMEESRVIMREVNAELFALNMGIIRDLLLNHREPRAPANPAGPISAFDFDLQMVEHEQGRVEAYMQRNRSRFTPAVVTDINDTMDPGGFGQSFNPSQLAMQWAIQALGVARLDFTQLQHRVAIGIATVHIFHRRSRQDYLDHMRRRAAAAQPAPTHPAPARP